METKQNKRSNIVSMTEAEYHASSRLSKHGLDEFVKNPWGYFRKKEQGFSQETESAALRFGSAFHTKILEQKEFASRYAIKPESIKVRRGKEWDFFLSENSGKEILDHKEVGMCEEMARILSENKTAQKLLDASDKREVSVMWEHEAFKGIELRSRVDFVSNNFAIAGDLKTAADATPDGFMKACDEYGYDMQAAFYMDALYHATGIVPSVFAFIVCEKIYPYTPAVYTFDADSDFIMAGRDGYLKNMKHYAEFTKKDITTIPAGFSEHNLTLPQWSKRLKEFRNDPITFSI